MITRPLSIRLMLTIAAFCAAHRDCESLSVTLFASSAHGTHGRAPTQGHHFLMRRLKHICWSSLKQNANVEPCAQRVCGRESRWIELRSRHFGKGVAVWSNLEPKEGEGAEEEGSRALEKALERRRRSRETPLSQKWFKERQKTITPAQKKALREVDTLIRKAADARVTKIIAVILHLKLWNYYGVTLTHGARIKVDSLFPGAGTGAGARRTVLDIGFGAGDSIVGMARADKEAVFLGVELHKSSIANTLLQAHAHNLTNVKVFRYDAAKLLEEHLIGECLDEACILFPDPWPNARDEQRRVLRAGTAALLGQRMRVGGLLRIATDVEAYASHAEQVLATMGDIWRPTFKDVHAPCEGGPAWRPVTRYERRAAELGHKVWELEYERLPGA